MAKAPRKPLSRKSKKALMSAVITVLVTVAIILVNWISVVLTQKYSAFTSDITSLKSFELTEQSKNIAQNLDKKVKITFHSEKRDYENRDPYCKQTSVIANELARISNGNISVEYIDVVKNPTLANSYTEEDNLTANDVAVSCGDKRRLLKVSDLFTFEMYSEEYQYIASSQSEQVIDNAIVTVTSDVETKVAVVSENDSEDYSYFVRVLEANNYAVSEISLEKDELPDDIQMVVIYQPETDFSSDDLLKLEDFMSNGEQYGKNLLYIPDVSGADHPNLDKFINMFGMGISSGIAFEYDESARYYSSDYYEYIFCDFASNLYRENLSKDKEMPVMTGISRPIAIRNDHVEPLLVLSEKSGILPYTADDSWSMEDAVTGNICVMAQSSVGEGDNISTLVVIGSGEMISQKYFINGLGNQYYILTMLNELNDRSTKIISLPDKTITNFDINTDAHTRFWIGFMMYAVIPLIILGGGLTVYLVRRNM